ncbi:MAG: PadR family transcriptional regulator [Gemmatimonadaceae bacterium]|nr:PadR family transcriptional regulator [Gemmatimonadaceae bacterium]
MFEHGDLKIIVLQLLDEKPRHGYEIIRELETRSGGRYSPSPGTVYPTLTMLEEMGCASSVEEPGGKRVYSITDVGRKYLAENRATAEDVLDRLADLGASIFGEAVRPAHEAMARLGRAYWRVTMRHPATAETIASAARIVQRAAEELEELSRSP